MRRLGLAASLALMAGCASLTPPPDYQVEPPAQWRKAATDTVPVEPQWWTVFDDPVRTTLVEHALANSNDVAIAVARIREARASSRSSRLATKAVRATDRGVEAAHDAACPPSQARLCRRQEGHPLR